MDKKLLVVLLLFVVAGVAFWKFRPMPQNPAKPQEMGVVKPPEEKPAPVTPPEVKPPEILKEAATYAEALSASKTFKRPIFLYFGAEWCHWCKKMKTDTLSQAEVKDKLGKEYIVCFIDTDKDKATARKYKVSGIPAYMVVASDETVITRASGFKTKADFLDWLRPKMVSDIDP
jgi:thiol:disulfide interchange protein